jgi:hypothetical protein
MRTQSSKSSSTLLIFLLILITFPFWIGIFAAVVGTVGGVIGGVFGAVFGTLGGLLGAFFSAITWPIRAIFGHGNWFPHVNGYVIVCLILVVFLISKSKREKK